MERNAILTCSRARQCHAQHTLKHIISVVGLSSLSLSTGTEQELVAFWPLKSRPQSRLLRTDRRAVPINPTLYYRLCIVFMTETNAYHQPAKQ